MGEKEKKRPGVGVSETFTNCNPGFAGDNHLNAVNCSGNVELEHLLTAAGDGWLVLPMTVSPTLVFDPDVVTSGPASRAYPLKFEELWNDKHIPSVYDRIIC